MRLTSKWILATTLTLVLTQGETRIEKNVEPGSEPVDIMEQSPSHALPNSEYQFGNCKDRFKVSGNIFKYKVEMVKDLRCNPLPKDQYIEVISSRQP